MNAFLFLAVGTGEKLALDLALLSLLGLLFAVPYLAVTLVLLLPGCFLREALRRGDERSASQALALRQSLTKSRALAFARRLMKHDWTSSEVVVSAVFVLTTAAAVLAILVAGYVLGLARPTAGDKLLPWVLGGSIAVSMAYAWAQRKAEPWLAAVVIVCGTASVILISLLKVEATVIAPADYLYHHPLKDRLLAPTWIAIESSAFAGSSMSHAGISGAIRAAGALAALLIEIGVAAIAFALRLGELLVRGVLVVSRLVLGLLLIPAEVLYRALRRRLGTDMDGNHHLPPISGGTLG